MKRRYLYLPVVAGILTPSLVIFFIQVFIAKISPVKSVLNIADDLFLLVVWSFIPFGALILQTYVLEMKIESKRLSCIFWGGFIPIFGFTLYGHISTWYPIYVHHGNSAQVGLSVAFIPIFCLFLFVIGSLIGWMISFLPRFRNG